MGLFKRQLPKARKFDGQFLFSNFAYGIYKQEVPRVLEEQLASLALLGGRNIWSNRGALTQQYGYESIASFNNSNYFFSCENSVTNQNVLIALKDGTVLRYDDIEGLKTYKTSLPSEMTEVPLRTFNGLDMFLYDGEKYYVFGRRYDGAEFESLLTESSYIVSQPDDGKNVSILISNTEAQYFWIDKQLVFDKGNNDYVNATVQGLSKVGDGYNLHILIEGEPFAVGTHPLLGELALEEVQDGFEWIPETQADPLNPETVALKPIIMETVLNRLWIVNEDNTVYYSAVGNFTNFQEADGAGFFYGFYNDTSPILSIEEYFNGALITKRNGMYHVKITTQEYSFSSDTGAIVASSTTGNYLNINKLNNITQQYPGDHCIIGDEVIAYDAASGNLCQAVMINYFGNPQQGGILLHGSELDAENFGLFSATQRKLCYNFQEEVLIIYYGADYKTALVIPRNLSIFPREISEGLRDIMMFNQSILGITYTYDEEDPTTLIHTIISDFKRGTTIPNISSIAEFEPIALNGNKLLAGSIIEITELNNEPFTISTSNSGIAIQIVNPSFLNNNSSSMEVLSNMLYSNTTNPTITSNTVGEIVNSSQQTVVRGNAKWVYQKSGLTRIAAPLGGRDGLTIKIEFEPNVAFKIVSINLPDFSRGE